MLTVLGSYRDLRKLHYEELHKFRYSLSIICAIKSKVKRVSPVVWGKTMTAKNKGKRSLQRQNHTSEDNINPCKSSADWLEVLGSKAGLGRMKS